MIFTGASKQMLFFELLRSFTLSINHDKESILKYSSIKKDGIFCVTIYVAKKKIVGIYFDICSHSSQPGAKTFLAGSDAQGVRMKDNTTSLTGGIQIHKILKSILPLCSWSRGVEYF